MGLLSHPYESISFNYGTILTYYNVASHSRTVPRSRMNELIEFADENEGLLTSKQARSVDILDSVLVRLAHCGRLERLARGVYSSLQTLALSDAADGATIFYTTYGSTPTTVGYEQYGGPFTLTQSRTVKAFAEATTYSTSAVASAI